MKSKREYYVVGDEYACDGVWVPVVLHIVNNKRTAHRLLDEALMADYGRFVNYRVWENTDSTTIGDNCNV